MEISRSQLDQIKNAVIKEFTWSLMEPDIRICQPRINAGGDMARQILISLGVTPEEALKLVDEWFHYVADGQRYKKYLFHELWYQTRN